MAEIAVATVIQKMLSLVEEEAKLLGSVRSQVEEVKTELVYIQAFLKDADAKAADKADISHGLKAWIQDLRETAYSIEDIIDEYLLHFGNLSQRHGFTGSLNKVRGLIKSLKPRREIASKIRDIQKKVVKLKEMGSTQGFTTSILESSSISSKESSTPWHDPGVTSLFIEEAEIVGIESPKNEMICWLVEGTLKRTVISVVGMGGLGKTTLAKKVYDNRRVVGHFDCHAWITVSESFKMEQLLRNLIKKLYQERKEAISEGLDTLDEMSLITLIRQHLQDTRYVVVFDDVWKLDFWEFIKYVLPENEKGSRIIITTRNDGVASSCIESLFDHIHKMQPLSQESSWELFSKKAFQGGCPSELEKLSLDIVKRCGGLPLAIVAVGGLLSRKEKIVSQWKLFSNNLGSELRSNSHLEIVNTILSLSYRDLPYYLKSCFLYLAIYPEDYIIKCGVITRLWIAEGFVKAKRGVTLEDAAEELLTELIHRSLVQASEVYIDGKIRSCYIHDMMREVGLKKAEELSFCCVMDGETSSFDGRFRRLSIHNSSDDVGDITSKKSHIRSIFIYNSQPDFLDRMASKFKLLKILDLTNAPLDSVHEDLGNLFHLRYLSLRKTRVRMLPRSIGKLQNLQTLDLKYSLVEDLPVEINRIQKLRNILSFAYVYRVDWSLGTVRGVHVQKGIGGLGDLQRLTAVDVTHGVRIIKELGELRQLRKLGITKLTRENGRLLCASITNMKHLKYLLICSSTENEILDLQYISCPPPLLSTLYLAGRLEKLPDWISKLPNLVRVGISGSNLVNDPMQVFQALPLLQELRISKISSVEQLCFGATGFRELKRLNLYRWAGLKRVKIEDGALPLLEEIAIGPCPLLEELPAGLRHLTKLTTLEFADLKEELKHSMIPYQGRNYWIVEHIPNVIFTGNETPMVGELPNELLPSKGMGFKSKISTEIHLSDWHIAREDPIAGISTGSIA